ncbi:MAG: LysR family transcriptional regulator [Verrucomicrobiales bacterium]|nr:LysR family transcriptional regulator [Verrucomicrobiales bacterium]
MTRINDLRQVRAFVQVCDSGSISAAARVLGVPQPTVSRQLQALEKVFGLPLVRRDTHNLSLTEAGRTLLPDAKKMLEISDRVGQSLTDEQNNLQGHLRIVSVVDIGQWIASRILAKFCALHPAITAELHLINRPTNFIEEGFDCGLLIGEPIDESLVARHIANMPRSLVASPGLLKKHGIPARPDDLQSLPWLGILQPRFLAKSRLLLRSAEQEVELDQKPTLLLDSITALREAVRADAGFAILPNWIAAKDLSEGTLVSLLPSWNVANMNMFVSYSTARQIPRRLRAFVDFVREEVPLWLDTRDSL